MAKRTKVHVDQFCGRFYDETLEPRLGGGSVMQAYLREAYRKLLDSDPSFAAVRAELFEVEMLAIRFELFGAAWTHELKDKDKYMRAQILFTRKYLRGHGLTAVWEGMLPYNHAVAASSSMLRTKFTAGMVNNTRAKLFDGHIKAGLDETAAAYLANRSATDVDFTKSAPALLARALLERLGHNESPGLIFGIQALAFGLYKGAREAIAAVEIEA